MFRCDVHLLQSLNDVDGPGASTHSIVSYVTLTTHRWSIDFLGMYDIGLAEQMRRAVPPRCEVRRFSFLQLCARDVHRQRRCERPMLTSRAYWIDANRRSRSVTIGNYDVDGIETLLIGLESDVASRRPRERPQKNERCCEANSKGGETGPATEGSGPPRRPGEGAGCVWFGW